MKNQWDAFLAELLKIKYSKMIWATLIAFGLAPVMGAVFMLIIQDAEALENAGGLAVKAKAMNFEANWKSYLDILVQAVGVGGVLIFGFVASWIFGREYSEGTAKDMMALPTSRRTILNAKFMLYVLWCVVLVLSNLLAAAVLGNLIGLSDFQWGEVSGKFYDYLITTVLTVSIGTPIAFFALYGKGYLAPLGFVALTLVFAQVIAATGYGTYFPWSIPGLYSGAGGAYKSLLDMVSYGIVAMTAVLGYISTVLYWNLADHSK